MFLVRMIYASRISEAFQPADVEKILHAARDKNEREYVSGLLCFNRKYFLQCLEGSRSSVNQTYHRILNDPRHTEITLLSYTEIIAREFDQWSMGYMPESTLTEPLNLKYSGTPDFNPFDMSGESSHRLMLELRDSVPVVQ